MNHQNVQAQNTNSFLEDSHRSEWLFSEVHPSIIQANVVSLSGNNAYERLLYGLDSSERTNTGRLRDKWLKRYDHLDHGGWWCNGVDLTTLQPSEWGCFKPQRPKIAKGKPIKYETPPHVKTGIFALEVTGEALNPFPVGDKSFWQWAIDSPGPIVITEGAKKAGALLTQGEIAIALSGIYNFTDADGQLKPEIQRLIRPGREFVIAFDQDKRWHVRNNIATALRKLGELLHDAGCVVTVLKWEYEHGKGIDDFLALKGNKEFAEIFDNRLELEDYLDKTASPYVCKRIDQFAKFLDTQVRGLEFNELLQRVEWDGQPIRQTGAIRFKVLREFNVIASEKMILDGFEDKALQSPYNPVRRYLDGLKGVNPINLDQLSSRYFGTTDPIYNVLLKKWLIGAVARIYQPGCKFDNALILQGDQWAGKSQFFKIMGGDWFDDSFGSDVRSPKALMTLHRCWIQEWAEFDRITSKSEFHTIKDFLSCQCDTFVKQYGRDSDPHPRMSIMAGSINPTNFLRDATGDRRFWVIPLPKGWKVPYKLVQQERDQIWAAAVQAYKADPDSRYLTTEEFAQHQKINEQFRDADPWLTTIENYLRSKNITRFSMERLVNDCLNLTIDKFDKRVQNRLRECLLFLRCESIGSRQESEYDGKARNVWQVPAVFPSQVEDDCSHNGNNGEQEKTMATIVEQNPDTERVTMVTMVNNGEIKNNFNSSSHNGNNGEIQKTMATIVEQNPDTERVTMVTMVNNGKSGEKSNSSSHNGNGKKSDPDEETYEQGIIKTIAEIFNQLGWDDDQREALMLEEFGEAHLEYLSRSDLMDLVILLYKERDKLSYQSRNRA